MPRRLCLGALGAEAAGVVRLEPDVYSGVDALLSGVLRRPT